MKKIIHLIATSLLLGSSAAYSQLGIDAMVVSAKNVYVGDTVTVSLYLRNHNFSKAYNPESNPVFISVGLPAGSKIFELASERLEGTNASAFTFSSWDDAYNFTFDLTQSIPSVLEDGNVYRVDFKLLAVKPNPAGSEPQFLVQLQYPLGDLEKTDPLLQSAMSPIFHVADHGVLNVGLGDFTAVKTNQNSILLNWNTLSEHNSKGFEIEKSLDGKHWQQIGYTTSLAENGNSSVELKYNFEDLNPFEGYNFFRLKMLQLDGAFDYSPVRKVFIESVNSNDIHIFPNPTTHALTLQGIEKDDEILVYDIAGKRLKSLKSEGSIQQINVATLPSGTYLLEVSQAGRSKWQTKFVKE